MRAAAIALSGLVLAVAGCSSHTRDPKIQYGANPQLPEPKQFLFPPMKVTKPTGWQGNEMPTAPAGFTVTPFATGLHSPRRVLPLTNGDVLVVESAGPGVEPITRPKDIIFGIVIGGAHGDTKPENRVLLIRDTNGDGRADATAVLIPKLYSPFGIVQSGNALYVAATDAIIRYDFTPGQTSVGPGKVLTELPAGAIDHHWTKDLTISPDGTKLYVGIGSNSNITENGIDAELDRAQIWEVDVATGAHRPFATGLRNPNGLVFQPGTNTLYTVVNERDELGNDLVPDYMTSVRDGAFYGWPYSYYGQHVDIRVRPQQPAMVRKAISPDYSLSSHVAPLGLAFGPQGWPGGYAGGAFIGEHGSWDREVPNGYEVAFVPFAGGKPAGPARTFLGGFLKDGVLRGRPVGVAFDREGALLVADDGGNAIWRVAPSVTRGTNAPPKPPA